MTGLIKGPRGPKRVCKIMVRGTKSSPKGHYLAYFWSPGRSLVLVLGGVFSPWVEVPWFEDV